MTSTPSSGQLVSQQLGFERNNQLLLTDISFRLQPGDILQLRGANGSGKSTLLRILAGYIEPHEGSLHWNDQSIDHQLEDFQQHIQYLGHQNGMKPTLTVEENLKLIIALTGKKLDADTLAVALEKTGLHRLKHTLASKLSAGQARRLSLTRLILHPVQLWLLDEPTTALDAHGEALFAELLSNHLTRGGSAIVATHHELVLPNIITTLWLGGASHD